MVGTVGGTSRFQTSMLYIEERYPEELPPLFLVSFHMVKDRYNPMCGRLFPESAASLASVDDTT